MGSVNEFEEVGVAEICAYSLFSLSPSEPAALTNHERLGKSVNYRFANL